MAPLQRKAEESNPYVVSAPRLSRPVASLPSGAFQSGRDESNVLYVVPNHGCGHYTTPRSVGGTTAPRLDGGTRRSDQAVALHMALPGVAPGTPAYEAGDLLFVLSAKASVPALPVVAAPHRHRPGVLPPLEAPTPTGAGTGPPPLSPARTP